MTSVTSPGTGNTPTRQWQYNGQNWLVLAQQPESGSTTYTYDAVGNLAGRQDAKGQVTTYTYDANNRLTGIDAPGSLHDVSMSYDESGNRLTVTNGSVASTFTYDAANRLTARTDVVNGHTFVSQYTLDGNGNLTDLSYPSGNHVAYQYDSENRVTRVFDDARGMVFARDITYDPSGGVAGYWSGDGTDHTYTYDTRQRVTHLVASGVLDLTYTYAAVGNVLMTTAALDALRRKPAAS